MAQALPRPQLNDSPLARLLARIAVDDGAPRADFAERLGQWLDVGDAIALYAALEPAHTAPTARMAHAGKASAAVRDELRDAISRARRGLMTAIEETYSGAAGARIKFPAPEDGMALDLMLSYAPVHRCIQAHQRDMDARLAPLRERARQALATASPSLRQLAALDAVLGPALAPREASLLAGLPVLLEKRHALHLERHRAALAESGAADDPALWLRPGGWLAEFRGELREMLLAELDLRLRPAQGLIEAYSDEVSTQT